MRLSQAQEKSSTYENMAADSYFIPGKVVSSTVRVIYNIWKIDLSVNITLDPVYVQSLYHHHNVKSPEKLTVHTTVLYTPITTNTKCIIFYHGTIYSLIMFILSTTLEEGYIVLYLEITFTLVNKYLSDPAVIIKCHLDQNWYNIGIIILRWSSTLTQNWFLKPFTHPFNIAI